MVFQKMSVLQKYVSYLFTFVTKLRVLFSSIAKDNTRIRRYYLKDSFMIFKYIKRHTKKNRGRDFPQKSWIYAIMFYWFLPFSLQTCLAYHLLFILDIFVVLKMTEI